MSRPRTAVLLLLLALLLPACGGGGGGDGASEDDLDQVVTTGERSVQVAGAGKVRLGGTLFVPQQAASSPRAKVAGVLFVPSLTSGDRNGFVPLGETGVDPLASDLAKSFAQAGLASYRYDGRGTGESKLEPNTRISFDDLVADAKAGVDLLAERKETAGTDLAVVGYDTGGLVALRLAATDLRVKRLVLLATPGRPLVDFQAANLTARYGPESGEALRAAVGQLQATKSVPAAADLRTELRPLLPADQAPFLSEVYSIDPRAEASRVKAATLIVSPSAAKAVEAMAPQQLASAITGSQLLLADKINASLLVVVGQPPADDPGDPNSMGHIHGWGPGQAKMERDPDTVNRITTWLAAAANPRP